MLLQTRNHTPSLSGTAARGVLFDPEIRSAAAHTLPSAARLGFLVSKRMARERARRRVHRAGDGISALGASLATNLPQLAEQLGIYEPPRRRRGGAATAAAGIALATAVAILLSDEQARRRLRTALGR